LKNTWFTATLVNPAKKKPVKVI